MMEVPKKFDLTQDPFRVDFVFECIWYLLNCYFFIRLSVHGRDDDAVWVRRRRGGAGSSALYGLVNAARVRGGVVSEALLTGFTSAFKGEAASSCAQLGRRRLRYRANLGGRGAFHHA